MTTNEIRKKFLDFFASKGHTIVTSDSLVPKDDPTVLFTTAGMQQFKRQFLGQIGDYTRATTAQKCLRTDDLDKVGKTDFHHTFFEMLGNFSFGDYFKREAITWAWEFLTKELKISPEKLWVSVYTDDPEAKEIWLNEIKINPDKLVALGDHSNFWPADAKQKGPNGPCGPCSEIFFDYGYNPNCGNTPCDPSCNCGRFSEVWNLVFTQFDRKEGGILEPLPNKNIDTGMGLERLAAVHQGKKNNFETDLFALILKAIQDKIEADKFTLTLQDRRVMSDHIRAIVFGINDGVIPSNEGRGYVIKKLIIDITDIAVRAGVSQPVIHTLTDSVIEAMKIPYPELSLKAPEIAGIIRQVEEAYLRVRNERVPEFKNQVRQIHDQTISSNEKAMKLGEIIFTFRDTYGLTIPTLEKIVSSLEIPEAMSAEAWKTFHQRMSRQQQKSRASSKMTGDVFADTALELGLPKTEFSGYKQTQSSSTILKMFINNQKVHEASQGDHVKVVLDKTPFYAEAGGQVGDTGIIFNDAGRIRVEDTQKIDDIFIHSGTVEKGFIKINDQVRAEIDCQRRLSIMRNHTATHLLQTALREILGPHVKQQGSLVDEDRLRFDFTHHKALTREELTKIEERVNALILACDHVTKEYLPIEQAKDSGALAFFAEKYGNVVRVVTIGHYSKEFCGGTHLDSTGQIGLFKITEESAIAQGIRRLEAKTGISAMAYIHEQLGRMERMAQILKAPTSELVERLDAQSKKVKQLERDIENLRFESIKNSLDSLLGQAEKIHGTHLISHCFQGIEMSLLRKVADLLKQKTKSSIIVLGAKTQDNASILISVSEDLVQKNIKADEIIKKFAPLIHGSGGGRAQLAQAGSRRVDTIDQAFLHANQLIKEDLKI
ncbi:MAG TPA: alanine--tRNA ligase [Candidatus Omnitrophica bacterium]|nr:MAG: alanine--tRNA ligase [Omnitrophica WOR_2 bacterium GWA2_45_18]OGX18558.1 MAG: alanine--tRNA ligase [Omnitrophica WOR_2 bacterium GWC2_45_7]HBR15479.1 alanine--tRNA ligase [Candidatus Omnitrophota bacterium]